MRGTFANVRLRNRLAPGTEGGVTVKDGEQTSIYDAAMAYADEGVPLCVLAGKEYGSGSSRDWAAKGPRLLGVRFALAESYERIHRSNLVGMGVLPLQFPDGESVESLGLTGFERFDLAPLEDGARTLARDRHARRRRAGDVRGPRADRHAERVALLPRRRHPPLRAPPAAHELTELDPHLVRERFPALAGNEVFFDGPGGSQAPAEVIDAMVAYLRSSNANLGGAFRTSVESDAVVERARAAAAEFTGSEPEEIAFGANMTTLNFLLAHAVARTLEPGDEIVVTDLDHDANVSPWLLVAGGPRPGGARGADPGRATARSTTTRSRRCSGERTRVVAFTLASNALGSITDAGADRRRGRARRARSPGPTPCTWRPTAGCGARELGIDVLLCSPYKFFGPHLGVAAIERGLAESLPADRVRPAGGVAARAPLRDRHPVARGDRRHDGGDRVPALARRRRPGRGLRADPRARGGAVARASSRRRRRSRARPLRDRRSRARGRAHAHLLLQPGRPGAAASWRPSWRRATSTCGTGTTTRSRRCARSGWRSGARCAPASSTTRPRTRWTGCWRRSPIWPGRASAGRSGPRLGSRDALAPAPRARRPRGAARCLAGCAAVDVRRLAGDDTAGRNNNTRRVHHGPPVPARPDPADHRPRRRLATRTRSTRARTCSA